MGLPNQPGRLGCRVPSPFGLPPDEPPLFETWLARVHVDDRPKIRSGLEEVLRGRDTWDHTYRFVRADGTVLWMQSLGRADRDAAGQVDAADRS